MKQTITKLDRPIRLQLKPNDPTGANKALLDIIKWAMNNCVEHGNEWRTAFAFLVGEHPRKPRGVHIAHGGCSMAVYLLGSNEPVARVCEEELTSIVKEGSFEQRVVDKLKAMGIGASLEFQGNVELDLGDGNNMVCGAANDTWGCDVCDKVGVAFDYFPLEISSEDESEAALEKLVGAIAELYRHLNTMTPQLFLVRQLAAHLQCGRDESEPDHKLAMLDGGMAQDLIDSANEMLPKKLRVISQRA